MDIMTEEIWVLNELVRSFITLIPNIIGTVLLLLFGWVIGRILGTLVKKILKKLKMDQYFKLDKGVKLSEIISVVVSWIIYFAFIQAAVQVLGITALSTFFGKLVELVAGLLGGVVVILVGYVIARYVQRQLAAGKTEYSGLLGQLIFFFTMIIAVSIAFNVARIPTKLIDNIILILVASVGLGVAIALGLGLKDTISRLAKKYEKKL